MFKSINASNSTFRVRTRKELGALLREFRRKQKLTQAELAESIGVSRRWVVQVEQGKTSADLRMLLRALKAVGAEIHIRPRRVSNAERQIAEIVSSRRVPRA